MVTNRSKKFLSSRDHPKVHPLHVSRCQMLHLLFARPPGLLERKINNKAESFIFFLLYCDVYTDMDNRERDSAGRTTTGKFYRSSEKMRNASGQQREK